jgi:hypothetical protein
MRAGGRALASVFPSQDNAVPSLGCSSSFSTASGYVLADVETNMD